MKKHSTHPVIKQSWTTRNIASLCLAFLMALSSQVSVFAVKDEGFYAGNDIIYYDPDAVACAPLAPDSGTGGATAGGGGTGGSGGSSTPSSGSRLQREKIIYKFLLDNGLGTYQAVGLMGNMDAESSLDPNAKEAGGTGYGLIQWSFSRRTDLQREAAKQGVPVSDIMFQLNYMVKESKSRGSLTFRGINEWEGMKKTSGATEAKAIYSAALYWQTNAERPRVPQAAKRAGMGQAILKDLRAAGVVTSIIPPSGGGSSPAPSSGGSTVSPDGTATGVPCGSSGGDTTSTGGTTTGGTVNVIQKITLGDSRTIKPTAIILHWWGYKGGIDSLISVLKGRGLSVQFATTVDAKVYQLTQKANSRAAHAVCANGWAIGNEIEASGAADLAKNQAQYQSVVNITGQLMKQFNIPLDGPLPSGRPGIGVHSHKEVDSLSCGTPGRKSDVDDVYLARVKAELKRRGF